MGQNLVLADYVHACTYPVYGQIKAVTSGSTHKIDQQETVG